MEVGEEGAHARLDHQRDAGGLVGAEKDYAEACQRPEQRVASERGAPQNHVARGAWCNRRIGVEVARHEHRPTAAEQEETDFAVHCGRMA